MVLRHFNKVYGYETLEQLSCFDPHITSLTNQVNCQGNNKTTTSNIQVCIRTQAIRLYLNTI